MKSSGAVSPATRATAITTPVRMPPIAVGRTMLTVVRQRVTPSARLASRRLRGTISSTSCVARATIGSISTASENAPKIALWPRPTTSSPKTKMPTTIAGTPFRTSRTIRSATETRGPAYSDMKIATRMLIGIAITIAMPTISALPTRASAMPPVWPKSGRAFVKKSRLTWLRPLWSTVPRTRARMPTAITALATASPANAFSVSLRRRRPAERAVMS